MPFIQPNESQAHAGLRAIVTAITSGGPIHDVQRSAIDSTQRCFLKTDFVIDRLTAISPEELAAAFPDPALAKQIVGAMAIMVIIASEISPKQIDTIHRYAKALGVDDPSVDRMRYAMKHRVGMLQFDILRRGPLKSGLRRAYDEDGVKGVFRLVAELAGHGDNPEVAARWAALEKLPAGTVGREFWQWYQQRGFIFPGNKGGTPSPIIPHDLAHLLGGYDTDTDSEVFVKGFEAGFKREDPMLLFFLVAIQASLDIEVTRLIKGIPSGTHYFDDPTKLEEVWKAYHRGTAMNVDLQDDWDYWAIMDQPLDEVRRRYNIPPAN